MRETRADTMQSLVLAVVLHLLLFGLVFLGLSWTRKTADPAGGGPPVEAEMVDAGSLSDTMQAALANRVMAADAPDAVAESELPKTLPDALESEPPPPPPQPEPEPEPQEAQTPPQPVPPTPQAKPDTRDQDEARRDAASRETREREQEALRRQRQIELQKLQQAQAAEQKQRLAAQQKAEAEAKAKAASAAKAKAEADAKAKRAAALAAQRAQQLADAKARAAGGAAASTPGPASGAGDAKALADWGALIGREIERNWRRAEPVAAGEICPIRITVTAGGVVNAVQVLPACPYSEANKASVERAVRASSPLPMTGNEDLRFREITLRFRPSS